MEPPVQAPIPIDLNRLAQEIAAALHAAELHAAELRGQLKLITRLSQEAQQPTYTGDSLDESQP